jgi:hypothetical protein
LIEDRNIAIDFGSLCTPKAGNEVSIDLARRIGFDRATAARLVSALNTCLREHESRWRITTPGEKPAIVSRAPTASKATSAPCSSSTSNTTRTAQEASRTTPDAPATLHVAFKWDTADPERRVMSRYLLHPALSEAQILERMSRIYRAGNNDTSLDIARAVPAVASTRVDPESLQYLEVQEDGNDRPSFDLNFYDASLLVRDLQAPLAQMRQRVAIKPGQFQALYDQIKPQTAGHLADRHGRDFFNVYYGVQKRRG